MLGKDHAGRFLAGSLDPVKVSLTALADGKEIAVGSFELIYLSPDVERIPVKDGRLLASGGLWIEKPGLTTRRTAGVWGKKKAHDAITPWALDV